MNFFGFFKKREKKKKAELLKRVYPARPWADRARSESAIDPDSGIHFIGDLGANIGLGESARLLVKAMKSVSIPLAYTESVITPKQRMEPDCGDFKNPATCDVSLIHLNGDATFQRGLIHTDGACSRHAYVIAYWYWELPGLTDEWMEKFRYIDELWVASRYVQDHMAQQSPVPVVTIPLPVEDRVASGKREAFDLPEYRMIFLFIFDPTSSVGRKNPFAVVEAFRRAFASVEKPPLLVLKAHHMQLLPGRGDLERDLGAAMDSVGGKWIGEDFSRGDLTNLMGCSDCFVSLHRCEGFGLGIAEAMMLGKPVIATGYSANMDFMTPDNSYPVGYRLTKVKKEDHKYQPHFDQVYHPGQVWSEPDVGHAAQLMREVFENPTRAAVRGALARQHMLEHHSFEKVGSKIKERLGFIAKRNKY